LRQAGHLVFTPTLSGLAERAHLRTAEPVTLSTHIEDVVEFLYFEDLTEVILVGWSYGGGVVDGVADRVRQRLARVVNLDGEVAREGHLLSEGWTEEARAEYRAVLDEAKRSGWITPPPVLVSITDPVVNRWVMERARPHPVGTYTEAYPDRGSARYQVPHTFLRCGTQDGEEPVATALRSDPRWSFRGLPGVNHLGLFYAPDVIADALLDLAT
jgi:pimeloyl-ACP methyl ester carboxylesterase